MWHFREELGVGVMRTGEGRGCTDKPETAQEGFGAMPGGNSMLRVWAVEWLKNYLSIV